MLPESPYDLWLIIYSNEGQERQTCEVIRFQEKKHPPNALSNPIDPLIRIFPRRSGMAIPFSFLIKSSHTLLFISGEKFYLPR
jgi:hypothetical protein